MSYITAFVRTGVVVAAFLGVLGASRGELAAAPATRPSTGPATRPAGDRESKVARARVDIANLGTALDSFEIDCGRFPTTEEGLAALRKRPADTANWHGPYIGKLESDPWGHPYQYRYPGSRGSDFDVFSTGPDGREGGGDDIGNWGEKK